MIYGFALLLLLISLVTGIPAFRQLILMQNINKHSQSTPGIVASAKSSMGWLWTSSYGNQDRPRIKYQSPRGDEMILEITTSSILPKKRYEAGQAVDVIFDSSRPGRAYLKQEWGVVVRELWISTLTLLLAIVIWTLGRIYNLPF